MRIILSFDCGTENMGVCVFFARAEALTDIRRKLEEILDEESSAARHFNEGHFNDLLTRADQIVELKFADLVTVKTPGALKNYLEKLDEYIGQASGNYKKEAVNKLGDAAPPIVLIERQFVPGSAARGVCHFLQYHYANREIFLSHNTNWRANMGTFYNVFVVGASLKNSVDYDKENSYSHFAAKYKTNYTANKEHSLAQFNYLTRIFNQAAILNGFRGKKKRDIADAYMMGFNWILKNANQIFV